MALQSISIGGPERSVATFISKFGDLNSALGRVVGDGASDMRNAPMSNGAVARIILGNQYAIDIIGTQRDNISAILVARVITNRPGRGEGPVQVFQPPLGPIRVTKVGLIAKNIGTELEVQNIIRGEQIQLVASNTLSIVYLVNSGLDALADVGRQKRVTSEQEFSFRINEPPTFEFERTLQTSSLQVPSGTIAIVVTFRGVGDDQLKAFAITRLSPLKYYLIATATRTNRFDASGDPIYILRAIQMSGPELTERNRGLADEISRKRQMMGFPRSRGMLCEFDWAL